ncbi:MAG TPA: NAD-dependent epimerase/dehydratase family protein [Nitrospira sp.]|nr:NAD-dependent epimerase/dehydratase family protein [Nitrospira sp.]HND02140.1 NAD-dependent epimerase/dehydratase family protein [Nitrospira sp.]HNI67060.1 NAD-dependent epimerase/dehydratase family protein [Nitrospira sp.]HNL88210.1 NAD-dependent epimerase/dehydratase family protein [Nitrospira sp.]
MRIVITGAEGFIGKNLRFRLRELGHEKVTFITEATSARLLSKAVSDADIVFHLAGVNRPQDVAEYARGNTGFTELLCEVLRSVDSPAPIVFSSSTQVLLDNPYGRSKLAAEWALQRYGAETGVPTHICRLTNVFGKWAMPNYNSVVATFCYNISRGLEIRVNDPSAPLRLVYIDDVVDAFCCFLEPSFQEAGFFEVQPTYTTTVGEVADMLRCFWESRQSLHTPPVGTGLARALYATYVSYLPPVSFAYRVPRHGDPRGVFVEMLKTPNCGQFSYFTAPPGATRGEHYHHSKTEKFLVIRGRARFGFRHIISDERYELTVSGGEATIVETAPGWTHNISNIGDEDMIVMLWANEVFDPSKPDTVAMKVHA